MARIKLEMDVGIPNPLSLPYSHSTALMEPGMRTALLGISLRRLLFGPGPRTPRTIASRRKIDHQNLPTNPFNSTNLSPTTGTTRASGRTSPSYLTPKVSPVRVNIPPPGLSNRESSQPPR